MIIINHPILAALVVGIIAGVFCALTDRLGR